MLSNAKTLNIKNKSTQNYNPENVIAQLREKENKTLKEHFDYTNAILDAGYQLFEKGEKDAARKYSNDVYNILRWAAFDRNVDYRETDEFKRLTAQSNYLRGLTNQKTHEDELLEEALKRQFELYENALTTQNNITSQNEEDRKALTIYKQSYNQSLLDLYSPVGLLLTVSDRLNIIANYRKEFVTLENAKIQDLNRENQKADCVTKIITQYRIILENKNIDISDKGEYYFLLATYLINLGHVLCVKISMEKKQPLKNPNPQEARKYTEEAFHILTKILKDNGSDEYQRILAECYHLLARTHREPFVSPSEGIIKTRREYYKAAISAQGAIKIKSESDLNNYANYKYNLGISYFNGKEFQLAFPYLENAAAIIENIKNKTSKVNCTLASYLYHRGNCAIQLTNPKQAQSDFVYAIDILNAIDLKDPMVSETLKSCNQALTLLTKENSANPPILQQFQSQRENPVPSNTQKVTSNNITTFITKFNGGKKT